MKTVALLIAGAVIGFLVGLTVAVEHHKEAINHQCNAPYLENALAEMKDLHHNCLVIDGEVQHISKLKLKRKTN